jgi:diguanylate cyclase (GGDEF)-like protein
MSPILIVEDSSMFGGMAKKRLEEEFEDIIIWTKSLADTRKVLQMDNARFDVALVDYNLPDAPKGEVIDEVVNRGIPSIVFTGDITDEVREFVWSKQVADYITKDDLNCFDYIISAIKRLAENNSCKVLVVDDTAFYRKIFCDLLYIQQYQVIAAKDGKECLAVLEKYPDVKLVITDYNMPGMDGFTLCKKIREKFKKDDMAIIGISSNDDKNMAAKFIKSGANDFLLKDTFLVEEFYCRVTHCIETILLIRQTKEAAIRDFLTGLYNRRYFFDTGDKLFSNSKRDNIALTCAMVDIDFFKRVNDSYGHDVGDLVIQRVSSIIQSKMRETDIVSRFGGEEFCVLAVNMDAKHAAKVFNELREEIENTSISTANDKKQLQVTVSIGVCTRIRNSLEELVKAADELLYKAKENGRNRVEVSC